MTTDPPEDQEEKEFLAVMVMLRAQGDALEAVRELPSGSARLRAFVKAYVKANKEYLEDES